MRKRIWIPILLVVAPILAAPIRAGHAQPGDEVIVELPVHDYVYGDTSDVRNAYLGQTKDGMGAAIRPFGVLNYSLPRAMTNRDAHYTANDGVYQDQIGVWMECPAGYTVTVATSFDENDHWSIGEFVGPLDYGCYWSPFSNDPNIDRVYGGTIYATVEIHKVRNAALTHRPYAMVDAVWLKYLDGTLGVASAATSSPQTAEFYDVLGRRVEEPKGRVAKHLAGNRYLVLP